MRRPDGTASQVLKQDLALRTDGERFYRGLTVHSFKDSAANKFESFGEVGPPCSDFELVVFKEADAILCVLPGCYVLAPLKVNDKTFFIESGCFVDEDDQNGSGQLPISVRGADDDEVGPGASDSRRYLMRSTRLYARERELASVTTSYHQLLPDGAGGD